MDTVVICQACGMPSAAGHTQDLGGGDTLELCGQCDAVNVAVARLGWIGYGDAAGFTQRRELVGRILDLLDQADKVCDVRYGDQPSRLAEWFREDGEGE